MPARAVPSTSSVQGFAVWNTARYSAEVCFMYSRNFGSNWPSSGAAIACSTRGWALIGPGPISSRSGGFRSSNSSAMGMMLQPVARDVDAAGDPGLLAPHILDEPLERGEAAGPADHAAVQSHRHHPPALGVEDIERILQVAEEIVAAVEALRGGEPHVVGVERIRHDELRLSMPGVVPRQVVVVVVGVVYEAAVLDHQLARVRAGAPGVPAERPLAGKAAVDLDRAPHVLALLVDRHVLVIDPAPAVARDLVPGLEHRLDRGRVALHRHRHAIDGERQLVAREQVEDAPDADARAVLVERLHRHVAHALERLRADDLGQERLRRLVAVQDRVLAAFLVVEDEVERDAPAAGPLYLRRPCAVADEITRILHGSSR